MVRWVCSQLHSTCRPFILLSLSFSLWVKIWKLHVLGMGRKMTQHISVVPQWSFLDVCFHVVVQSPSCVQFLATPWTVGRQASLSLTISQSLPKFICSLFSYIFTIWEWIKNIRLIYEDPLISDSAEQLLLDEISHFVNAPSFPWRWHICAIVSRRRAWWPLAGDVTTTVAKQGVSQPGLTNLKAVFSLQLW